MIYISDVPGLFLNDIENSFGAFSGLNFTNATRNPTVNIIPKNIIPKASPVISPEIKKNKSKSYLQFYLNK